MSLFKSVHHINFIVADLDAAVQNYERILGLGPFEIENLEQRGVRTARVRVGDVWIVLVSPQRTDSDVGRYLQRHGEGFFLLSFGVDDLGQALDELTRRAGATAHSDIRQGLSGWRVADLETQDRLGVAFHLTELD